jgi:anti-sigma factor (TIGR02949 family)
MPDTPREPPVIDCLTAVRQLWDYLDDELTEERLRAVQHHLESCGDCLPHRDFARQFLQALQAVKRERPMPTEVRRRVMARLAEAGFTGLPASG